MTPCDTWHGTRDTQGVVKKVSKLQVPSSYILGVKVFFERYREKKYDLLNCIESLGVCRTSRVLEKLQL